MAAVIVLCVSGYAAILLFGETLDLSADFSCVCKIDPCAQAAPSARDRAIELRPMSSQRPKFLGVSFTPLTYACSSVCFARRMFTSRDCCHLSPKGP